MALAHAGRAGDKKAMTDPLDRPIWHALTGRQAGFALGAGLSRRFHPEVSPFAACADDSPDALAAVAALVGAGERFFLIHRAHVPVPPGTREVERMLLAQMVAEGFVASAPPAGIVALGAGDVGAMIDLATLTEPGPFRARTHELSQFWGVKDADGRLLAMAGERLRLAGMSEVSGVCSHPDARGRGYAALLSRHVASEIVRRGEVPFLHAYAANDAAIGLYERLRFRHHGTVEALLVERA